MDWIYAKVEERKIKKICNDLLNDSVKNEGYKICSDQTLCLIPSFNSTKTTNLPTIGNSGFNISPSGFRYYPSLENPMKIMLDLSNDSLVQLWQDELVDQIGSSSIHRDMEPPSIDLIGAGKMGQEKQFNINGRVRDNLIDKCEEYSQPEYIKIKEVTREILD
jgi:hypothetical protein